MHPCPRCKAITYGTVGLDGLSRPICADCYMDDLLAADLDSPGYPIPDDTLGLIADRQDLEEIAPAATHAKG